MKRKGGVFSFASIQENQKKVVCLNNDNLRFMKIFFDDRCLKVLKPDEEFEGQIVVPGSEAELKRVIRDFGKNSSMEILALSGPDYKKLKRDVKSLFTVVEAAGGVVKNEKGEILFIFRRGKWDLPKGKIEKKEEHSGTGDHETNPKSRHRRSEAVREVQEETGIRQVNVIRKIKPTYHVYHEKGNLMLKKSYWFEMTAPSSQKLIPQVDEDIRYVKWFSPDELPVVLGNTFGSLREMIEKHCT